MPRIVREAEIEKSEIERDSVRENPNGVCLGSHAAHDQGREENKDDATDYGVRVTGTDVTDPAPKAGR